MFVRRVRPPKPLLDGSVCDVDPVWCDLLRSFGSPADGAWGAAGAEAFPRMNITQDEENLYLHAEIPGVDPDRLSISALRNSVSLAGKRVLGGAREHIWGGADRADCAFDCTVALPAEVDADRVDAGYCAGILALTLPKVRGRVGPGRC